MTAKKIEKYTALVMQPHVHVAEDRADIKRNVDQGQHDLRAGNIKPYKSINPLKGTRTAFKKGFGSK